VKLSKGFFQFLSPIYL